MAEQDVSMAEKDVLMVAKDSIDLWFIGNGFEDHLITADTSILEDQRPQCIYCYRLGHTRDRCYQLHGRPPCIAHLAQFFLSFSEFEFCLRELIHTSGGHSYARRI